MPERVCTQFKIDDEKELTLVLGEGVFTPTGTSKVLFKAAQAHLSGPRKVLDLGCGCGVVGIALHEVGRVKGPLRASDLSENAVASAVENAAQVRCPIDARVGALFDPWHGERFETIVDDVSGVAEDVARISPWFDNIPCAAGGDGADLICRILDEAPDYLQPDGEILFPVISFSNVDRILKTARNRFEKVERLAHEEWPLPKDMAPHVETLRRLRDAGTVQFVEKFGMILWFTDVYVASGPKS